MKEEILKEILKFVEENEEFSSLALRKHIENTFFKDGVDFDLERFINRELSRLFKEKVLHRISRGQYIDYKKNKPSELNEFQIQKDYYLDEDHLQIIKYLNLYITFNKEFVLSGNSLERQMGINIQRGGDLKIILNRKPSDKVEKILKKINVTYVYLLLPVTDLLNYSIINLLRTRVYDFERCRGIYKFMERNGIITYDLLNYSLEDAIRKTDTWKFTKRSRDSNSKFKINYINLEKIGRYYAKKD